MSNLLLQFSSHEIVQSRYRSLHNKELSTEKALSISTHIDQGVAFLQSAKREPVTIRPISQYYGVAALARALTMYLTPDSQGESGLTNGHGIKVSNWRVLSGNNGIRGLADLKLTTCNGLYLDVLRATKNIGIFRVNSSRPDFKPELSDVPERTEIEVQGLLGLVPELWSAHTAWSGIGHPRLILQQLTRHKEYNRVLWNFVGNAGHDDVKLVFPDEEVDIDAISSPIQVTTSDSPHFQPVQHYTESFGIGSLMCVPPLSSSFTLSPLAIYMANSFMMSMLARYRLSQWMALWRGGEGDAARPLLEGMMESIDSNFPIICSDLLEIESLDNGRSI